MAIVGQRSVARVRDLAWRVVRQQRTSSTLTIPQWYAGALVARARSPHLCSTLKLVVQQTTTFVNDRSNSRDRPQSFRRRHMRAIPPNSNDGLNCPPGAAVVFHDSGAARHERSRKPMLAPAVVLQHPLAEASPLAAPLTGLLRLGTKWYPTGLSVFSRAVSSSTVRFEVVAASTKAIGCPRRPAQ